MASSAFAVDTTFQYEMNPDHNTGKCVDVDGGNQTVDAHLMQFTCNDGPNQRFRFESIGGNEYRIRAVHSNQCLDVLGADKSNGAEVVQHPCNGGANQRFRLLEDRAQAGGFRTRIQAVHSNRCLDVPGSSNANRVFLKQFDCHNGLNQKFSLTAFTA
jgi:hypothetical protein